MHRWLVVALVVVGCDKKAAAPVASGSGSAVADATPVAPPDVAPQTAGPPNRTALELAQGTIADSRPIAQETTAKGCTPPTTIAIVKSSFPTAEMCLLVVRRGAEYVVDTDLQCTKGRVSIASAECVGDGLEVVLAVGQRQTKVACAVTTEARCKRDVLPDLFDRELAAYLEKVSQTLAAHDKQALLALFAAEHKRSQLEEMGQSENDYIHENLGFHTRDVFERIQRLESTDVVEEHGYYNVTGWVTLADGKRVRARFMVQRTKGGFELTGAVG